MGMASAPAAADRGGGGDRGVAAAVMRGVVAAGGRRRRRVLTRRCRRLLLAASPSSRHGKGGGRLTMAPPHCSDQLLVVRCSPNRESDHPRSSCRGREMLKGEGIALPWNLEMKTFQIEVSRREWRWRKLICRYLLNWEAKKTTTHLIFSHLLPPSRNNTNSYVTKICQSLASSLNILSPTIPRSRCKTCETSDT